MVKKEIFKRDRGGGREKWDESLLEPVCFSATKTCRDDSIRRGICIITCHELVILNLTLRQASYSYTLRDFTTLYIYIIILSAVLTKKQQ